MFRKFLKKEENWRLVEAVLIIFGIIVASYIGLLQYKVNQQLLDLNYRILIDFEYDDSTGIATFHNVGNSLVDFELVRVNTSPPIRISTGIQKKVFPKQFLDINLKEQLSLFFKESPDNYYGGAYEILLFADTPTGNKPYIGWIPFSLRVENGEILFIVPSKDISIYRYQGNGLDFVNETSDR